MNKNMNKNKSIKIECECKGQHFIEFKYNKDELKEWPWVFCSFVSNGGNSFFDRLKDASKIIIGRDTIWDDVLINEKSAKKIINILDLYLKDIKNNHKK